MNELIKCGFDLEKLKKLNLLQDGKLTQLFYNVYCVYSNYFLKYIDRVLFLSKYDFDIKNSPFNLKIVKENLNFYQKNSYLRYFYIRSNLHIENLTKNQIEMLNNIYLSGVFEYNINIINFIEETYLNVLKTDKLLLAITYIDEITNKVNEEQIRNFLKDIVVGLKKESNKKLKLDIEVIKIGSLSNSIHKDK